MTFMGVGTIMNLTAGNLSEDRTDQPQTGGGKVLTMEEAVLGYQTYSGDSMVADARGREVGSTSPGNEAIIRVELDIEKLRQFRKKFPVLDDRDDFLFREK